MFQGSSQSHLEKNVFPFLLPKDIKVFTSILGELIYFLDSLHDNQCIFLQFGQRHFKMSLVSAKKGHV